MASPRLREHTSLTQGLGALGEHGARHPSDGGRSFVITLCQQSRELLLSLVEAR
jgi:hypothetical protein